MTTSAGRETAVIIQFPKRARPVASRGDDGAPAGQTAPKGVAQVAAGGAWYHEAAIQEAERAGRR